MEDMAALLDMSRTSVSYWEADKTEIPKVNALALEYLCRISSVWLLTGEGPMWIAPVILPQKARGIVEVPVLTSAPTFEADGETLDIHPDVPRHPFSKTVIQSMIAMLGTGNESTFFFIRAQESGFSILQGDLVLVNSALALRQHPVSPNLHVIRTSPGAQEYMIRRLFNVPPSLNTLSASGYADTLDLAGHPIESLVMGRVCTWIHLECPLPQEDTPAPKQTHNSATPAKNRQTRAKRNA